VWLLGVMACGRTAWPLPAPLELEDRPKPLTASRARTEADQDRLEALALFATGRTYEQRQELDKALRYYERAQRCDPAASSILEALIPLAVQLGKEPVAVRYAMRASQAENLRPLLLRRLGKYLEDLGQIPQAVTMYEKALAARLGAKPDAADVVIWRELGRLYYLTEQYPKAAEQFARVLEAMEHPQDFGLDEELRKAILGEPGLTYQLFGESFLLSGRGAEAAAAFEKSQALAPNEALWKYNQARLAARGSSASGKPEQGKPEKTAGNTEKAAGNTEKAAGNTEKAAGSAEKALAFLEEGFRKHLADQGLGPYSLLAELLEKLGRQKELIGRLEKLHAERPQDVPLGYFLAERYREAGQLDKAQSLYAPLLKSAPTTIAYRSLAEMYRKAKRIDALLDLLGDAVEKSGTPELLGPEARAIRQDAALLRALLEAGRQQPKGQPAKLAYARRVALALLLLDNKQCDQAGEWFELALAAEPKRAGETLLMWGIGLLLAERPAEAAKVLQRGIAAKTAAKDEPALYFYLAGALALADRTDEALAAAHQAAALKKSARPASRAPWILDHAKRTAEATRAYEELLAKFGDDPAPETREVLLEARLALSNLCVLGHDLPAAEEWLEQVLDEFPDDVSAANDLGFLWADQGKHLHRALAMVQKAVAAEPENTAYRDSLGWALFRLGRCQEAVVELEKAAADKKPDAVIFDHLGDARRAVGQNDRAAAAWRKAAELYRKDKDDAKLKETEAKIQQVESKPKPK
jgi:tetratricopeptide (TPR) repeat protein